MKKKILIMMIGLVIVSIATMAMVNVTGVLLETIDGYWRFAYREVVNSNTNALSTDYVIVMKVTGTYYVDLPKCDAKSIGQIFVIKSHVQGGFLPETRVRPYSGDNIEGTTTYHRLQDPGYAYSTATYVCGGSKTWYIIAEKMN